MSAKKEKTSPKTAQKVLSARKRLFAKLRYEDKINDEQIAQQCGINRRRIYEWDKEPEVIAEMKRLGRADTEKALRFFQRSSLRAAQATVKLTETRSIKDKEGKETKKQEFVQPGEVVRKASADILQGVEINVKGGEKDAPSIDDLLGSLNNGDIERRAKVIGERARKANQRSTPADGD